MGNTLATDTIPVLITMVDVHHPRAQDQFYFCNVSTGGASTKVVGRSQTLSAEVGITTLVTLTVYECPEPVFTPETARFLGVLRIPIERLAERYSSGIFQQWFNLDTKDDPRQGAGNPQALVSKFEQSYTDAIADVYAPKICLSVIGTAFEVARGARQTFSIFVGEDVKTSAGPDLKALIASHKQQAAYIDALHEELRKVTMPSYRAVGAEGIAQPAAMAASVAIPNQTMHMATPTHVMAQPGQMAHMSQPMMHPMMSQPAMSQPMMPQAGGWTEPIKPMAAQYGGNMPMQVAGNMSRPQAVPSNLPMYG